MAGPSGQRQTCRRPGGGPRPSGRRGAGDAAPGRGARGARDRTAAGRGVGAAFDRSLGDLGAARTLHRPAQRGAHPGTEEFEPGLLRRAKDASWWGFREQLEGRASWLLETVASVVARMESARSQGEKRLNCSRSLERDGLYLVVPGHYFMNTNIFGGAVILMSRMRTPRLGETKGPAQEPRAPREQRSEWQHQEGNQAF